MSPFCVSRDHRENNHQPTETSVYNPGKSASRFNLANPSKRDLSGTNGHANGDASRRYCIPHDFGLVLNLLHRVSDHEPSTETKSRHQSRPNLGEMLRENGAPPHPQTKTHQVVQGPLPDQGIQTRQTNQQMNGAFLSRYLGVLEGNRPPLFL